MSEQIAADFLNVTPDNSIGTEPQRQEMLDDHLVRRGGGRSKVTDLMWRVVGSISATAEVKRMLTRVDPQRIRHAMEKLTPAAIGLFEIRLYYVVVVVRETANCDRFRRASAAQILKYPGTVDMGNGLFMHPHGVPMRLHVITAPDEAFADMLQQSGRAP